MNTKAALHAMMASRWEDAKREQEFADMAEQRTARAVAHIGAAWMFVEQVCEVDGVAGVFSHLFEGANAESILFGEVPDMAEDERESRSLKATQFARLAASLAETYCDD